MNLNLFNNLLSNIKENNIIQNFIKELSTSLEKENDNTQSSSLKKEDCLYQVVEMSSDGAYLQNINDNRVHKETGISKEVLEKIGNDSVLRYKDGNYIYEEELTRKIS